VTVDEIAAALGDGLGVTVEPERTGQYRAGDIRHCFAATEQAEKVLGFRSQVALEDGLRDLAGWLAGQSADDHVETATRELVDRGLAR
jgi:dTDP-L-rhamnose 4-epimerase